MLATLVLAAATMGGHRDLPDAFSGTRALDLARTLVAFGPRVPGTAAHDRAAAWIAFQIRAREARLVLQDFTVELEGRKVACRNLTALTGPAVPPGLVLVAHWDTRPWSDREPDASRRRQPGPGANDGASGVAVLLEMLPLLPRDMAIATVFVDAEDVGQRPEDYAQGSRAWVRAHRGPRPRWALVLDMVGRADARFAMEAASRRAAPWLVDRLWSVAGTVGAGPWFSRREGPEIIDDHTPFIEAGIPAVDLVDMADPAWHTHQDDIDRLDAGTMAAVGRAVLALVAGEPGREVRKSSPSALSVGYDGHAALSRERSLPWP